MIKQWEGTIRAENSEKLQKKVDFLNRRAGKIGAGPLSVTFSEAYVEKKRDEHDLLTGQLVVDVVIEGVEPRGIEGWEPIAVYQREKDAVLVRRFPNVEVNRVLRPTTIGCDHCKTKRFRKSSILLRNVQSRELMEVGTACVRDFIGYEPASWIFLCSLKDVVDEYVGELESCPPSDNNAAYELESFLNVTAAVIRESGWMSKTKAQNLFDDSGRPVPATADLVTAQFWNMRHPHPNFRQVVVTDADKDMAKGAVERIEREFKDKQHDDYLFTCHQVIGLGYVPSYQIGLSASIVGYHSTMLRKESERDCEKTSEWMGSVKERITVEDCELVYVGGFDTDWGYKTILTFRTDDGNLVKWMTTTGSQGLVKGDKATIVGTVKKHEDYKDVKSTMLTRCKVTKKEAKK